MIAVGQWPIAHHKPQNQFDDMKTLFQAAIILLLHQPLMAQSLSLAFEDLEERYNEENTSRYFYQDLPYSGKTTNRHEAEKKIIQYSFVDGYIERQLGWDFAGNKVRDFSYRNGVPHGKLISSYSNGQKYFEADYMNGKAHGMEHGWYRDGNKRLEVQYTNGVVVYRLTYPRPE